MHIPHQLSTDEASRLAITAAVADLEYWARHSAVHGQIDLDSLVGVLDALREASAPQYSARPTFPALAAS